MKLSLSRLAHTWFIDLDGTVLAHNGHLSGDERLLPGVLSFWETIPPGDTVILLSARKDSEREASLRFIRECGLRYDLALFDLPTGERVLINDRKPSGLPTAFSVNVQRDEGLARLKVLVDPTL
jgi:hypothetical protein